MKNNKILMTIALLAMAGSAQPAAVEAQPAAVEAQPADAGTQSSDAGRAEGSLGVLQPGTESGPDYRSGNSSFLSKFGTALKARWESEQGKARTYFSARDVVENYEKLKPEKVRNYWLNAPVKDGDYKGLSNREVRQIHAERARLNKLGQLVGLPPADQNEEHINSLLLSNSQAEQDRLKQEALKAVLPSLEAYDEANFNPANIDFKESVLDKIRYNPGAVRFGRGLSAAGRVANVANFAREAITGRNAILELLALNKTLRGNALFNKLLTGKKGARALRFLISSIQALLLDQAFAAPVAGKRGVLSALFRRGSDEEDDLDVVKTAANSVADVHSADGVSL